MVPPQIARRQAKYASRRPFWQERERHSTYSVIRSYVLSGRQEERFPSHNAVCS